MVYLTNHEEVVDAVGRSIYAFANLPKKPVEVQSLANPEASALSEIASRYHQHGYAIVRSTDEVVTTENHLALTLALNLGAPFVPPLYFMGGQSPSAVSVISAASNANTSEANHPSFGARVGQALHVDGTLQSPGFVKATLMSCQSPAAEGGLNLLFDARAVFGDLLEADPEAAVALMEPDVLSRRANINGCTEDNVGPAVTIENGVLVGRFCETETDSWNIPDGEEGDAARRGIAYFRDAAREGSQHFRIERLAANEAIIFDNTRLSHGRTSYTDSPQQQRCMYRTLHTAHPSYSS